MYSTFFPLFYRFIISICFETDASASGLQWLPPEQTAGRKHPYLFSQCQVNYEYLTDFLSI